MELHAGDTDGTTTSESPSSPKRLAEMKIGCSMTNRGKTFGGKTGKLEKRQKPLSLSWKNGKRCLLFQLNESITGSYVEEEN